jgi:hypothetical protein
VRDLPLSLKVRSTPLRHRPAGHSVLTVWARPGSLAATAGISFDFSAEGTEMFQFPCGPPLRVTLTGGVSPFGDRRITGGKTPPRRFRCQAPSFIGSAAPGHSPCAVNYLRVLARARLPTLSSTDALGKVQRLPNSGAGGGVGLAGLEPATSVLSGLRSHHLS